MSTGLRRFFIIVSWTVIGASVLVSALMATAAFALTGSWANRVVAIVPAVTILMTLGLTTGGMLRALVSIDERLARGGEG